MKHRCLVFILSVLISFSTKAAVQTYTFSQSCIAQNWLILNSPLTECEFEDIEFLGETFNLWLFTNSVQTDMSNIVTFGERYIFMGDGTAMVSLVGELEAGDIVDGSFSFLSILNIESESYETGVLWPSNLLSNFFSMTPYVGLEFNVNGNIHYGWLKFYHGSDSFGNGVVKIEELAIETIPGLPIIVGSTTSIAPASLLQTNNPPYGIDLSWAPYPSSVACQVRGGILGGTDPHNFIVQGIEPTELFINGNGLTAGQNYQWKVRCALGLNPYSGVTPWSAYDYFVYDP